MTPAFNGMLFDRSLICASCGAAVAAVIVAALALVVGRFVRGRPAPLRYGLLLAALVVLGIVPAVAAASRLGGWAALHISPSAVDRPLATRPFIARPEMPRPSPSPSPSPSPVVAADDDFVPPEQIHRIEKTVAAPLRMPTLREAASGLLWAWLGGLLFFVGMVMRDLVRLRRLRQTLVPCPSPAAVGLLDDASRSVGLTQPPRLFESAAVPVPVVIGPVKPVVVLPAGMANTLDHEKLTAVLLHEAAHVVHGDLWVGLLQHAVAAIFWWCPPVHRLNRRLAEVREEICDDYVVLAQGDGFQLAEVLVEMAAGLRGSRQRLTIGTLGAIDEKPALEGRVERLIDLTRKAAPMTRMNRLAVVAGGAFGLVALAIVLATTIHAADEVPDPAAIIAGIRENISAFDAFRCRYRYTVGVVPVARDGVNGPYFRRSADGLNLADRAEPCTEISWLRNGDVQLLEERLLDRNLVQELQAGKQMSSGTDDASELFNSDFGIKIFRGGELWEGGGHVRSVQIPFDFLDAEGSNRSLSLANLLERSFTRDGVALVRSEERSHEGRRIAELEFVGTNGDTPHVVYTIALDEGFLPVTIEIRESKTSEKVQRYHVTERRKIDGAGWLPMRCVRVYGSANGEGPAEVAMLEVVEITIGAPENSEFKTVLPKMYALHLGEMWDSQFINDVERPINLSEVERLISVAKRIAAAATPALRDISFDDIKLDMQKGDPFSRDLLPTRVTGLENSRVRIRGYILPSFQQTGLTQFVLVRDNMECCFGPGALLHDCVVVRMVPGKTAAFSVRPVAVTGTFRVQELRGPDGRHLAIYALDGETSVVAVDEAESGASADATGFLSQRFRLDQLLRGNADAAVVGASVPARVVGPLAGTAAEPKALAPPLGATEAEEPPAEAAAISREPEQAIDQTLIQPENGPGQADDAPQAAQAAIGPRLATVARVDQEKGEIELREVMSRVVWNPQRKVVYEHFGLTLSTAMEAFEVFDVDGQKLTDDEVWKRMAVGTVVAVSADAKKVDPMFLKTLAKDTLVVVSPMYAVNAVLMPLGSNEHPVIPQAAPPPKKMSVDKVDPEFLRKRVPTR